MQHFNTEKISLDILNDVNMFYLEVFNKLRRKAKKDAMGIIFSPLYENRILSNETMNRFVSISKSNGNLVDLKKLIKKKEFSNEMEVLMLSLASLYVLNKGRDNLIISRNTYLDFEIWNSFLEDIKKIIKNTKLSSSLLSLNLLVEKLNIVIEFSFNNGNPTIYNRHMKNISADYVYKLLLLLNSKKKVLDYLQPNSSRLCLICNKDRTSTVHHIIPSAFFSTFSSENSERGKLLSEISKDREKSKIFLGKVKNSELNIIKVCRGCHDRIEHYLDFFYRRSEPHNPKKQYISILDLFILPLRMALLNIMKNVENLKKSNKRYFLHNYLVITNEQIRILEHLREIPKNRKI